MPNTHPRARCVARRSSGSAQDLRCKARLSLALLCASCCCLATSIEVKPILEVVAFEAYPGYTGPLTVAGRVNLTGSAYGIQSVQYDLQGLDPVCGTRNISGVANACGVHVHAGTSCKDAKGHAWNATVESDPWLLGPTYSSSASGRASGKASVATGMPLLALGGKVLVVHDVYGKRAACGRLLPSAIQTLEHWLTTDTCYSEKTWRTQSWINFTGAFQRCGPSLVCTEGHQKCERLCTADEQCEKFPLRVCDRETQQCVHKQLFGASVGEDVGAAFLFFFISGLALSAGIGGGGLYVPLLMIILGFTVREATGVSQACLTGGASSALIYNIRQRHPSGKKPMIDYTLVLIMGPNLLIGALVGSILNSALPSWLILVLLTVILCHSAFKTFKKALDTLRKERQGQVRGMKPNSDGRLSHNPIERCLRLVGVGKRYAEFDDSAPATSNRQSPSVLGAPSIETSDVKVELAETQTPKAEDEGASNCPSEASASPSNSTEHAEAQYPLGKLLGFLLMWLVVLVGIFTRGGRGTPGIVPYCSSMYWVFALVTIVVLGSLASMACLRAIKLEAAGEVRQHAREEDGLRWNTGTAARIAAWSLFAGTLAALCGIGGGMIMGPKLLDLGFLPQVQSATTATTLFVMSSSTAIAFLVQGTAPLDYSMWLGCFTAAGAIIGKAVIGWIVKRARRPSVIMFLLGGIIAASVVAMFITGLVDVIDDLEHGNDMGFQNPCSVEGHANP